MPRIQRDDPTDSAQAWTSFPVIHSFTGRYAFLSSFYPREVVWDRRPWPDNEHPFQAAKTTVFLQQERIRRTATAGQAKQLGRQVRLRTDWEQIKFNVMLGLCRIKFAPTDDEGEDLAALLTATAPALLVEGNTWHDQTWGDCRCGRPRCEAVGANLLGLALMVVRGELILQVSHDGR